jgi:hypothetical protein
VPRDRPILHGGWTVGNRHGVDDLPSQLAGGGRAFTAAHAAAGPQMRDELALEHPARLDVEAAIDRLMRNAHGHIVGVFRDEPARDLCGRPILAQFGRHHHAERRVRG